VKDSNFIFKQLSMMSDSEMLTAAKSWIEAWNSGDFEQLLDHYSDDVIFYSTAAARRWNSAEGKLIGKQALEKHFRKAFEEFPGMKLKFIRLLFGTGGMLLIYERENGKTCADLVISDEIGKVKEVRVFA
jgi:hypothetical protein